MSESVIFLLPSLFVGLALGGFYFGGLWFSVHRLLPRKHAAAWFLLSFLFRNLIVLLGFYWIMDGRMERLLIALFGFSLVRVLLSKRLSQTVREGS